MKRAPSMRAVFKRKAKTFAQAHQSQEINMEMGATGTKMTLPGAADFTTPLHSETKTAARAKTSIIIT